MSTGPHHKNPGRNPGRNPDTCEATGVKPAHPTPKKAEKEKTTKEKNPSGKKMKLASHRFDLEEELLRVNGNEDDDDDDDDDDNRGWGRGAAVTWFHRR